MVNKRLSPDTKLIKLVTKSARFDANEVPLSVPMSYTVPSLLEYIRHRTSTPAALSEAICQVKNSKVILSIIKHTSYHYTQLHQLANGCIPVRI